MQTVRAPFLVREDIACLIEKRIEALERGYRQNMALVGLLGSGKTRLLSAIFQSLCAKTRFIPVYVNGDGIDFEHLADRWIGALLTGLFLSQGITTLPQFHSLLLAADPIVPRTTEKIRAFKKMMRREKSAVLIKELFSLSEVLSQETGKKMVLMLDEFDRLEKLLPVEPFSALGKEIMVQKNTLYLVASSSPVRAQEIFREKLSMLFGNFEVIRLGPLGFTETIQFLEAHLPERRLTQAQQQFLIRLTNGFPNYLELIADRIHTRVVSDAMNELSLRPPENDQIPDVFILEALHQELIHEKGRIVHWFEKRLDRCRNLAKENAAFLRVLVAISRGRHRIAAIASDVDRKILEVKKILARLVEHDFISRQGSLYVIEDPLFRFWLREVYEKRNQLYTPDEDFLDQEGMLALQRDFQKAEREAHLNVGVRIESLLKEFRNDALEIEQKKIQCPQFSEIILRTPEVRGFTLTAKNSKVRWHCAVAPQRVREEEAQVFLDEIKKYRKKPQGKILMMLRGIEQNAKLILQEAGVQLWDLRLLNTLLDLYELPKIVLLLEKDPHDGSGQDLGAVAQGVSSAG